MHWVVQSNIYAEENYEHLLATLSRLDIPHSVHKVVPFVGTLEPDVEIAADHVVVMGSYSLARHAVARGWTPGAFLENLDFEVQREHWGHLMLNHDAKIYEFGEIPFQAEPFFMRPTLDTKAYTGQLIDWGEYQKWCDGVARADGPALLTLSDRTMVCSKKEIYSETRTWVVDGRVVTCSGYKVGTIKRYTSPEQVDPRIVHFAQSCAEVWSPNRAYVLDVAQTEDGLKICEVNNLNSAGWYRCDMQKLVAAVDGMDL